MNLTRKIYTTSNEKTVDFLLGFFGWFILNAIVSGALYALSIALTGISTYGDGTNFDALQTVTGAVGLVCNGLIFLANVGLLIYFGLTRYWIALGALTAFAVSIVLVLCAAIFIGVACFLLFSGMGNR